MLSKGRSDDESRENGIRRPHGWKPRENASAKDEVTDRSVSLRAGESHLSMSHFTFESRCRDTGAVRGISGGWTVSKEIKI